MSEGRNFITKVYQILEDYNDDIICWNESGDGFLVKDVNVFSQEILPLYFKHSNYASFVRQLNMYDFRKIDKFQFKHDLFRRDQRQLLPEIKRKISEILHIMPIEQLDQELGKLCIRNSELETFLKMLLHQRDKLQKDNKFLWTELCKVMSQNDSDGQFQWWMSQIKKENVEQIYNHLNRNLSKKDLIALIIRMADQSLKKVKII